MSLDLWYQETAAEFADAMARQDWDAIALLDAREAELMAVQA